MRNLPIIQNWNPKLEVFSFNVDLQLKISKLEQLNHKLNSKLVNIKDKFDVREQMWSERCNKLKKKCEESNTVSLEYQHVLNMYFEQFKTIKMTLENSDANYAHPLPFASLYNALNQKTEQLSSQCSQLHSQLMDSKHQIELALSQLENEKKKLDSLDNEQLSALEKMESLRQSKSEVEQRNKMLEQELNESIKKNKVANRKLKDVIEKTARYINQIEFQ
jgi:chromosome segregation ATPase